MHTDLKLSNVQRSCVKSSQITCTNCPIARYVTAKHWCSISIWWQQVQALTYYKSYYYFIKVFWSTYHLHLAWISGLSLSQQPTPALKPIRLNKKFSVSKLPHIFFLWWTFDSAKFRLSILFLKIYIKRYGRHNKHFGQKTSLTLCTNLF